jgi:hypothetical protein
MTDRELVMEILKRLDDNFYDLDNPFEAKTDSELAADALTETLFNMGLDNECERVDGINGKGLWEATFKLKPNSYIVRWTASGYCGDFRYLVVASTLDDAKKIWKGFVDNNDGIQYSWEKAEKAVKNHYGGYIEWKENGTCDKEKGCYELKFDNWSGGSDHLRD